MDEIFAGDWSPSSFTYLDGQPLDLHIITNAPLRTFPYPTTTNTIIWSAPTVLTDINDEPLEVGDRVVWASKAPRDNPHPRAGTITRINVEKGTVTARADLPKSNRGQSSTLPAGRVMKVISTPVLPASEV